jgi:hypothetical protein
MRTIQIVFLKESDATDLLNFLRSGSDPELIGKAVECGVVIEPGQKLSGNEWAEKFGYSIVDDDGWRGANDGVTVETPIDLSDFEKRFNESTVCPNYALTKGKTLSR